MVDDFTRECIALVADRSLSGIRVGREFDAIITRRGKPLSVVSNNGAELTSMFIETFNGRLREELLKETLFTSLAHAREALAIWQDDYNTVRRHSAVGNVPPAAYATLSDPG